MILTKIKDAEGVDIMDKTESWKKEDIKRKQRREERWIKARITYLTKEEV